MEILRNRIWGYLVFTAFTLVNVVPAYALNVKVELNQYVKAHSGAKKDYQQDVAIYLHKVMPQLSKEDREFIIGLHQKYYAEKGANPDFIPVKTQGEKTLVFGKNSEAAFEVVDLEKGEFLINAVPFKYNANMPLKYNHTVVLEILKNSKSAYNWSLVPSAHAIFENGVDWSSVLLGAGIIGGIWWLTSTQTGKNIKDSVTPASTKRVNQLEERVREIESQVH